MPRRHVLRERILRGGEVRRLALRRAQGQHQHAVQGQDANRRADLHRRFSLVHHRRHRRRELSRIRPVDRHPLLGLRTRLRGELWMGAQAVHHRAPAEGDREGSDGRHEQGVRDREAQHERQRLPSSRHHRAVQAGEHDHLDSGSSEAGIWMGTGREFVRPWLHGADRPALRGPAKPRPLHVLPHQDNQVRLRAMVRAVQGEGARLELLRPRRA